MLAGLMLAWAGIVLAANSLKVQDVRVAPGESVTLNIVLENETTNLMGWQCDIVLPEGLTLARKANGRPAATLGERFATTEHSISSSVLANGNYRFIATSMEGEAIPGSSGTLFTVTLVADALRAGTKATGRRVSGRSALWDALLAKNGPAPTLAGKVTNIEFNTQDNQKVTPADVTFSVTIVTDDDNSQAITLQPGWNWVASCLRDPLPIEGKTEGISRVVSQTEELTRDPQLGMVGTITALQPGVGYKILAEQTVTWTFKGEAADANTTVALEKGWNWVGFPCTEVLPLSAIVNAEEGDRIVSPTASAEYMGGQWQGTLTGLTPGAAYLYRSASRKSAAVR